mmetsp:Transcript_81474/g.263927  ORF Transcript_81474/g.263927 Transcript_81474/m.263927 type:complete len:306 (+) Transcript_81474:60-977(+)
MRCPWRLCCGVLVAVAAVLWALPAASLVCRAREECNPLLALGPDTPPVGISMKGVAKLVAILWGKSFSGSGYVLVHVGASVTDEGDLLTPGTVPGLFKPETYRFVYVEPNTHVLAPWSSKLRGFGFKESELHFAEAAICPEDSEGATLYRPSHQLRLDHAPGLAPNELDDLSTFHKPRLLDWMRLLSPQVAALSPEQLSAYVENSTVRCATPTTLLKEAGVRPESIDQLGVDLFGEDALEIVDLFLALDGFSPGTVTFEYAGHHHHEKPVMATLEKLVRDLAARGYEIHRSKDDIIAMASDMRKR